MNNPRVLGAYSPGNLSILDRVQSWNFYLRHFHLATAHVRDMPDAMTLGAVAATRTRVDQADSFPETAISAQDAVGGLPSSTAFGYIDRNMPLWASQLARWCR